MSSRFDHLGDDLRLTFDGAGRADITWSDEYGEGRVGGLDNLTQALTLRLLVQRGELAQLGHPRFGSRLHESIGVRMTRANLELLRRHIRRTLLADPRVKAVTSLTVRPLASYPNAVQITATVCARDRGQVDLDLALDLR